MSPTRTPMSAVDRAWLRMDTPENPMMICGVLALDRQISVSHLRRILEERFLRFRRFRQRVVDKGDRAYWQEDPLFDLDNHLHQVALPGNADKAQLQQLVGDLNSTALDFRRPLWQMHYIDNYQGGSALLIRIHHCIADGISLVRVMLSLTDRTPEPKLKKVASASPVPARKQSWLQSALSRAVDNVQMANYQTRLFIQSVREEPNYPVKLASTAGEVALDLLKLGLAPFEPKTGLRQPLSGRKQVAWAEPLDLAEVKACAKALGGTVNDILMCTATGALQRHFAANKEAIPECGLRVAVPFNLRPLDQPIETLGNRFGLVLVPLPVEVQDPVMCFRQVQENMNRLKRSYQAQVTYSLLDLFGRGPDILERRALSLLSNKASAVLTNVPGPKEPLYLAGAKVTQPMFWVPQSGSIGIGMSIFSYAGTVQFGITMDKNIQADPNALIGYFQESFQALSHVALAGRQSELERKAG
ncbi:wax ester/triacylglycerol synthase family O-acyltransferase [Marinobacter sp. M216]|uniref:diacylglycerol O-acyltransferase n=1 Tax=Marinobacter albus TaxID=3030833 RepID=A0ABT7H877_9GAMM|nr:MULTISPECIES: wax ester/triacylglycerol synthase family O-acyltransferase [unclassified Marinobacter]MBW7471146.1 wax ester/triacylglycerol synthase family O-acyltransferase [Marinobacter sp. F4218]MDK9556563.1 wax ester/triacylglycerol synthase family O-acyltransferase [Marinobacter sp. M216]